MKLKYTVVVFVSLISLVFPSCNLFEKKTVQAEQNPAMEKYIGKRFDMTGFIDTSGNLAALDLNKAPLTLIDIWFDHCPSCISEMKEFKTVLKGKEEKINVVSISINSFPAWKKMLPEAPERYSFLKENVSNWQQLIFSSTDKYPRNNSISPDRLQELEQKWTTHTFPVIFVLDNSGIIKDMPLSAVDYIKKL